MKYLKLFYYWVLINIFSYIVAIFINSFEINYYCWTLNCRKAFGYIMFISGVLVFLSILAHAYDWFNKKRDNLL